MTADGLCWWCQQVADSREHKWPRSLLALEFGPPEKWDSDPVVLVKGEEQIRVRGSRAKALTFEPVLCRTCNDTRSQPFDTAAIALGKYVKANERRILTERELVWDEVDPARDGEATRRNFTKYMLKFIGCTLTTWGIEVPQTLIEVLDDYRQVAPELHLVMEIRTDIVALLEHESKRSNEPMGAIWSGGVTIESDPDLPSKASIYGHYTFRFLRVNWTILKHRGDGGSNFDVEVVELPEGWNVPPSEYPWNRQE